LKRGLKRVYGSEDERGQREEKVGFEQLEKGMGT
jgi:hypothetical protein